MLLLVIGRWLVGWCFPKGDLELLDDPIPEQLYCRGKRKGDPEKSLTELEELRDSVDEEEKKVPNGGLAAEHNINITDEVNRCDLWKHMVRHLDKEPNAGSLRNRAVDGKSSNARTNLSKKFEEASRLQTRQEKSPVELSGFEGVVVQSTSV